MRILKIPAAGESVNFARIDRAERQFAKSLAREAAPEPNRKPHIPGSARVARQAGLSLGAGFAALSSVDFYRAQDHSNALRRGVREAQHQRDFERQAAQDPDFLRSLGFHGRDEDDF